MRGNIWINRGKMGGFAVLEKCTYLGRYEARYDEGEIPPVYPNLQFSYQSNTSLQTHVPTPRLVKNPINNPNLLLEERHTPQLSTHLAVQPTSLSVAAPARIRQRPTSALPHSTPIVYIHIPPITLRPLSQAPSFRPHLPTPSPPVHQHMR